MKLSTRTKTLLFEAYRRNDMTLCDSQERSKTILQRWLGLGTAAGYRAAIDAGLMVFHDGSTPPPRCQGWLVLTVRGVTALVDLSGEFAQRLARLKKNPNYAGSILSQYQLAGGVSA